MAARKWFSPFLIPIYFFGAVIAAGTIVLKQDFSLAGSGFTWIDSLFTATSATCVTGLIVVDTGSFFTPTGQTIIAALIQLGGLGIMTYTSLVFYLWRKRISLTDRVSITQNLLHEPTFSLEKFLFLVVVLCLIAELLGAAALLAQGFEPFPAAFHAVSAFCNAGFSLQADSLMGWRGHLGVNAVFMVLIVLGGLGFSVVIEIFESMSGRSMDKLHAGARRRLSWHAATVLKISAWLIVLGAAFLLGMEALFEVPDGAARLDPLAALFQSVTARTAGFNTVDIGSMTNVSLLVLIGLMFIGGSPGSCAGGIKTTTFAGLLAFARAQLKGRRQAVFGKFALDQRTMNKILALCFFALGIVLAAVLALSISEGLARPGGLPRGMFLDIFFETVSAFATVGLSTGITPELSPAGKLIITAVMFVGRLGPILFLSALQEFQSRESFSWPENSLLVG